jgi:UDP-3-O-[3-hydroxymyristoyl] glucosamine N-acyltransferase
VEKRGYRLKELAEMLGGELCGDGRIAIDGVATIEDAEAGDITFVASSHYTKFLDTTRASAVIAAPDVECPIPSIRMENPYVGFLTALAAFEEDMAQKYPRGVHETAIIDPSAGLGDNVAIGPFCYVGPNAQVGDNSTLVFGVYVGTATTIGDDCLIYANVTIREGCEVGSRVIMHPGAVVGSDGFGYVKESGAHRKIPQIGGVVIEDDVELGANTTVDRATVGATRIGRGTKIDNVVHVAHNSTIGKNTVMAAQTGMAGSVKIGDDVVIAGQVGIGDHVTIGDGVIVAGQSGVSANVKPGKTVSGQPARDHRLAKRIHACTTRLPELYKKVRELEKKLAELEKGTQDVQTTENDR